jgi:hypothetical protein
MWRIIMQPGDTVTYKNKAAVILQRTTDLALVKFFDGLTKWVNIKLLEVIEDGDNE